MALSLRFRRAEYRRWLDQQRAVRGLRVGEVSDDEVIRLIRAVPTHYAVGLVSSVSKSTSGTSSGIDTTGATLLVLVGGASDSPTPTDSKSNTWTAGTGRTGSNSGSLLIWWAVNPTVGSGHTFTWTGSFGSFCVAAFSGVATTTPKDQENGTATQSSGNTTGSVTPTQANELIIAAVGGAGGNGTISSVDSGFTIAQTANNVFNVNYSSALAYLIQGSAAAVNPAWTFTGNAVGADNVTFLSAGVAFAGDDEAGLTFTPRFAW